MPSPDWDWFMISLDALLAVYKNNVADWIGILRQAAIRALMLVSLSLQTRHSMPCVRDVLRALPTFTWRIARFNRHLRPSGSSMTGFWTARPTRRACPERASRSAASLARTSPGTLGCRFRWRPEPSCASRTSRWGAGFAHCCWLSATPTGFRCLPSRPAARRRRALALPPVGISGLGAADAQIPTWMRHAR